MSVFGGLAQSVLDTASIERLVHQPPETVVPLIPALLECLQDINWPVAGAALPILARCGAPAARAAQAILDAAQRDDVWKYWLVEALFPALPPDACAIMEPSVRRIAIISCGRTGGGG